MKHVKNNKIFYCYSLRLYHFILAFNEKCYDSKINSLSKTRYWTFHKSERLDKIIKLYNNIKYNI